MSEQMKKYGAVLSGILLICVILLMDVFSLPDFVQHTVAEVIKQEKQVEDDVPKEEEQENQFNKDNIKKYKLNCYVIDLPKEIKREELTLKNDMIERKCMLTIPLDGEWSGQDVKIEGKEIKKYKYKEEKNKASLTITLNEVYDIFYYIEEGKLYISFFKPSDIYDNIVVVDAGHGGVGVGTIQGEVYEKDINLSVTLFLKELLEKQQNIKVYYTRLEDVGLSVYERVDFANDIQADLFVSIHSNSFEDGGEVKGTEVLYSKNETDKTYHSKWFAKIMLKEVVKASDITKRGLVDGDYVHIVRSAKMPVALVEMGYMTNEDDMKILGSESGQKKLAQGICQGILSAMEEMKNANE